MTNDPEIPRFRSSGPRIPLARASPPTPREEYPVCLRVQSFRWYMKCYFQGCTPDTTTREHVPLKSFFPKDQRTKLITVPSCEAHNTSKSADDHYALAHICMNSSLGNQAREVFKN